MKRHVVITASDEEVTWKAVMRRAKAARRERMTKPEDLDPQTRRLGADA